MVTVNATKKTFMAKAENVVRNFYVIDAKDKVLGKVATKAAVLLRGKHKVTFTPHVDTGDIVIIVNADKVRITGRKAEQKDYRRFSGYMDGLTTLKYQDFQKNRPKKVVELAVKRMIQSGPLGNTIYRKLKVYAGESHPHIAQKPISVEIK